MATTARRGAGRAPGAAASPAAACLFSAQRTHVLNGRTVARAFATSPQPFSPAAPPFAGQHSPILNAPNLTRHASASRAAHSRTAVTRQSAGTLRKTPTPYSPHAPRNRVRSERAPPPPPFASTLALDAGLHRSAHPWRTTARAAQAPSATPMHARVLFELPGVASAICCRLRRRVLE